MQQPWKLPLTVSQHSSFATLLLLLLINTEPPREPHYWVDFLHCFGHFSKNLVFLDECLEWIYNILRTMSRMLLLLRSRARRLLNSSDRQVRATTTNTDPLSSTQSPNTFQICFPSIQSTWPIVSPAISHNAFFFCTGAWQRNQNSRIVCTENCLWFGFRPVQPTLHSLRG